MITIPDLHVGHGAATGAVTVFPVWADVVPLRGVTTGAAARVDVSELPDGSDVQRLSVTNLGSRPALLLEGELLEGGWQARALACDLLLAPKDSAVADVACVEHGRWHGATGHARRARRVSGSVQHRLRAAAIPAARTKSGTPWLASSRPPVPLPAARSPTTSTGLYPRVPRCVSCRARPG